ncbi:MogA/MoaB family molybdenum cofactor biosynthesis protein [Limnoraphis robusta]|uniref:Molybdenum cofactor biosynthesis protein B n=1 Tax=Limnoraphis robusta CCNP1315 TaxID=3110306 RepID=A0ABU5TV97_9CYAN|nr:MogA/MoaB family molybdenum cofactor biosynthesis protein [Limnoraphis robusta]MEA5518734.1 MogA/MoaB family molybdenum cofactor biosynthesis protein [Limnoraphis robusta CCNP1315]MEA5544247.1 MogA/MoaB family molybdenum cofactor biosynthesis protein [Limnoraphis robusta CCNP1324]
MNPPLPHPDASDVPVNCAVITVSDTRTPETDKSGQLIQSLLKKAGYQIQDYLILPDEPQEIREKVLGFCQRRDLDALMINGGTGIAPRDTTYDALERILEKILPGFGEIFRSLSYAEIGSRAIASRAVAGICQGTLVFSLPGSTNAVKLAMEKLILPELTHLVTQLKA